MGTLSNSNDMKSIRHNGVLILVGTGTNRTSKGRNWFVPLTTPNTYSFRQESPSNFALQKITTFQVTNAFAGKDEQAVTVQNIDYGKTVFEDLTVRDASILEPNVLERIFPSPWVLHAITKAVRSTATATAPTLKTFNLGAFSIPFTYATL